MAPRRHAADEDIGIKAMALHAYPIGKDRSAGEGAGRINGYNPHRFPPFS